MNPLLMSVLVFACTFGGALGAISLRRRLPDGHLDEQAKDTVKVGIGLVATMTALILGLVTASAKSTFDAVGASIKTAAADVLTLDRVLARYGHETDALRASLKQAMADRIEALWPAGGAGAKSIDVPELRKTTESMATQLLSLTPQTDEQRYLKERARDLGESLLETRWRVFAGLGTSIPLPFLIMLIFWLTITFASFGLFAPGNSTVVAVLFVCAISVAGAVFLVMEMDGPFQGLITVSPDPLKYAVAHLDQ
jgi:hypothetical protein